MSHGAVHREFRQLQMLYTQSGLPWDRDGVHATRRVPWPFTLPFISAESRARSSAFRGIPLLQASPPEVAFAKYVAVYRPVHCSGR